MCLCISFIRFPENERDKLRQDCQLWTDIFIIVFVSKMSLVLPWQPPATITTTTTTTTNYN